MYHKIVHSDQFFKKKVVLLLILSPEEEPAVPAKLTVKVPAGHASHDD